MNAIDSLIVAEHQLELRREAQAERLASEALQTGGGLRRGPVRRLAGGSARGLSGALAVLAARVDPIEADGHSTSSDRKRRLSLSEDVSTTPLQRSRSSVEAPYEHRSLKPTSSESVLVTVQSCPTASELQERTRPCLS